MFTGNQYNFIYDCGKNSVQFSGEKKTDYIHGVLYNDYCTTETAQVKILIMRDNRKYCFYNLHANRILDSFKVQ